MSFGARVFRVLIASPSDVSDEREIAVNTIQAWNDLNSSERRIVLLPLRWETHSAPEYGRRPQEVINRQVVDHCDLLVGIFWTRIGSPTGVTESGTLEEIERVARQGKPVMLYFSQTKQDPDRINLDQLKQLREFKSKTFPKALVENYGNQIEFRDKLSKQLEIQLRALLAEESQVDDDLSGSPPRTEVQFGFADVKTGKLAGQTLEMHSSIIHLEDIEELPDFQSPPSKSERDAGDSSSFSRFWSHKNENYYREMSGYLVKEAFLRPVRFWLKNIGGVGARDVYVDIRITSENSDFSVIPLQKSGLNAPKEFGSPLWTSYFSGSEDNEDEVEQLGSQKTTQLELPALQPQREISPQTAIVIGAKQSGLINVAARIYADSLSEPVLRNLQINWTVTEVRKKAAQLLEEAGIKLPPFRKRRVMPKIGPETDSN